MPTKPKAVALPKLTEEQQEVQKWFNNPPTEEEVEKNITNKIRDLEAQAKTAPKEKLDQINNGIKNLQKALNLTKQIIAGRPTRPRSEMPGPANPPIHREPLSPATRGPDATPMPPLSGTSRKLEKERAKAVQDSGVKVPGVPPPSAFQGF